MRSRRTLLPALLLLACNVTARAGDGPPTAADFFRDAQVRTATLSPNGQYLAMQVIADNGRYRLVVADLSHLGQMQAVASYENADVRSFAWVNDQRLVYDVIDRQLEIETANGGLFAVDRDGTHQTELIASRWGFHQNTTASLISSKVLPGTYTLFARLHRGTDEIIVADHLFDPTDRYKMQSVRLVRLDTRTQEKHPLLERQPPDVTGWFLDPEGEPRVAISYVEGRRTVRYRPPGKEDWNVVDDRGQFDPERLIVNYVGYGEVFAIRERFDEVLRFDPEKPLETRTVLKLKGFEFIGSWETDPQARKVLGVHMGTDAYGTEWFDPTMAAAQKVIDAALPGTINTIRCGNCLSSRYFLVETRSDRQPVQFLLYDPAAQKIVGRVGASRPWLSPNQMGQRDFVRYPARDGLSIPAYVTLPPGHKKGGREPLVVLVHGGPWLRGSS